MLFFNCVRACVYVCENIKRETCRRNSQTNPFLSRVHNWNEDVPTCVLPVLFLCTAHLQLYACKHCSRTAQATRAVRPLRDVLEIFPDQNTLDCHVCDLKLLLRIPRKGGTADGFGLGHKRQWRSCLAETIFWDTKFCLFTFPWVNRLRILFLSGLASHLVSRKFYFGPRPPPLFNDPLHYENCNTRGTEGTNY